MSGEVVGKANLAILNRMLFAPEVPLTGSEMVVALQDRRFRSGAY
jgi:hypothetical protein